MKHAPHWTASALVLLLALTFLPSCCGTAGQVDAADTWPMVEILTERLDAYTEAQVMPDGSPMGEATQKVRETSSITLRNVWHAAMGRPLESLPEPPAETVGVPE